MWTSALRAVAISEPTFRHSETSKWSSSLIGYTINANRKKKAVWVHKIRDGSQRVYTYSNNPAAPQINGVVYNKYTHQPMNIRAADARRDSRRKETHDAARRAMAQKRKLYNAFPRRPWHGTVPEDDGVDHLEPDLVQWEEYKRGEKMAQGGAASTSTLRRLPTRSYKDLVSKFVQVAGFLEARTGKSVDIGRLPGMTASELRTQVATLLSLLPTE